MTRLLRGRLPGASWIMAVLLSAVSMRATAVGDTYDQVIAERGEPKSQVSGGSIRILNYPDAVIRMRDGHVVSVKAPPAATAHPTPAPTPADSTLAAGTPPPFAPPGAPMPAAPGDSKKIAVQLGQLRDAVDRVTAIVNQPIEHIPLQEGMKAEQFGPGGWFHPGAARPPFGQMDIQRTQEFPYARYKYVSSDLNPTEAFLGAELEFNSMTKFFYTDRTLPKKKLSQEEMLEINALYNSIAASEQQLKLLGYAGPMP